MSKGSKGLWHHTEEAKKKIGDASRGKVISEETKRKIGNANKISLKGNIPWNKGMKMSQGFIEKARARQLGHPKYKNAYSFPRGENHPDWKGDDAGYTTIHKWLYRHYGKASICENEDCGGISDNYNWALIHGKTYSHIRDNYVQLCRSCHVRYDQTEYKPILKLT